MNAHAGSSEGQRQPTPVLRTASLVLVPLSVREIAARVTSDDFFLPVDGLGPVHFGHDHPGELLGLYPLWAASLGIDDDVLGTWTIIHRSDREAIGSVGIKGPLENGRVEIGYGIIRSHRGRGHAREAVAAVCHALFAGRVELADEVMEVIAETRADNPASQRVLAATGFQRLGERTDPREGRVLRWGRRP